MGGGWKSGRPQRAQGSARSSAALRVSSRASSSLRQAAGGGRRVEHWPQHFSPTLPLSAAPELGSRRPDPETWVAEMQAAAAVRRWRQQRHHHMLRKGACLMACAVCVAVCISRRSSSISALYFSRELRGRAGAAGHSGAEAGPAWADLRTTQGEKGNFHSRALHAARALGSPPRPPAPPATR